MDPTDLTAKVQLARVLAVLRQKQLAELDSPYMQAMVRPAAAAWDGCGARPRQARP